MIINGEEFKKTLINDNYYVSKSGKLYNIKTNRFLYGTEYNGYIRVTIKKKLVFLHRLVYEAFEHIIPKNMQIDHIDGNKKNNALSNLRCVTPKENYNNPVTQEKMYKIQHTKEYCDKSRQRIIIKNQDSNFQEKRIKSIHKRAKKILRTDLDGSNPKIYDYIQQCIEEGFSRSHIYECCNSKKKKHHGYKFSYID